jgi:hypothetical protein
MFAYKRQLVLQRLFLNPSLFIFDAGVRGLPERVPAGAAPEQPQDVRVSRYRGGQPRERRLPRAPRQGQRALRRLLQGRRQVQGNGFLFAWGAVFGYVLECRLCPSTCNGKNMHLFKNAGPDPAYSCGLEI